jgi:hypothetical protein
MALGDTTGIKDENTQTQTSITGTKTENTTSTIPPKPGYDPSPGKMWQWKDGSWQQVDDPSSQIQSLNTPTGSVSNTTDTTSQAKAENSPYEFRDQNARPTSPPVAGYKWVWDDNIKAWNQFPDPNYVAPAATPTTPSPTTPAPTTPALTTPATPDNSAYEFKDPNTRPTSPPVAGYKWAWDDNIKAWNQFPLSLGEKDALAAQQAWDQRMANSQIDLSGINTTVTGVDIGKGAFSGYNTGAVSSMGTQPTGYSVGSAPTPTMSGPQTAGGKTMGATSAIGTPASIQDVGAAGASEFKDLDSYYKALLQKSGQYGQQSADYAQSEAQQQAGIAAQNAQQQALRAARTAGLNPAQAALVAEQAVGDTYAKSYDSAIQQYLGNYAQGAGQAATGTANIEQQKLGQYQASAQNAQAVSGLNVQQQQNLSQQELGKYQAEQDTLLKKYGLDITKQNNLRGQQLAAYQAEQDALNKKYTADIQSQNNIANQAVAKFTAEQQAEYQKGSLQISQQSNLAQQQLAKSATEIQANIDVAKLGIEQQNNLAQQMIQKYSADTARAIATSGIQNAKDDKEAAFWGGILAALSAAAGGAAGFMTMGPAGVVPGIAAGAGIAKSISSDTRVKVGVRPAMDVLTAITKEVKAPRQYSYRQDTAAQANRPGRQTGIMAQELERTPLRTAVQEGPDGVKSVDTQQVTMANTGMIAQMNKQLQDVVEYLKKVRK